MTASPSDAHVPPAGATVDAFHRGAFWLVQPAASGHRAGTDAMILAAAVPSSFSGRVADLGAGAGAAGLAILARCAGSSAVLVERSPAMAGFARLTLGHPGNVHLAGRARVIEADAELAGRARAQAGLSDEAFDFVVLNPPFNAPRDRPSPDLLRREAHVMGADLWERWLRTAAAIARPGGGVAVIARPESLAAVLRALAGRFGGAEAKPIHSRANAPAIRVVLRAWRGSRKRLSLLAPLILHDGAGHGFSAEADAVNNGLASLFGD